MRLNQFITRMLLMMILLAVNLSVNAQKELQVEYKIQNGEWMPHLDTEALMRVQGSKLLFTQTAIVKVESNYNKELVEMRGGDVFYKDYTTNKVKAQYYGEHSVIVEDMNLFKWSFENSVDEVLGYKCRIARSTFRGREYIVWFTTDLPFKASPLKINGIPGVVLKIKTADRFYFLEATKLKIADAKKELKDPFQDKKCISWKEYLVEYEQCVREAFEVRKAIEIKYGNKSSPTLSKLEIITELNRISVAEKYENDTID